MSIEWQRMSFAEYAAFESGQGEKIVGENGHFWRQVRPFFFRPVLLTKRYPANSVAPPAAGPWTAFQYRVDEGEKGNSFLSLLMFDVNPDYSLASPDWGGVRKQVKLAATEFSIWPVTDPQEFKEKAYPVYLDFYRRTGYRYKSARRHARCFSSWTDGLYRFPKAVVLGGYRGGELAVVSISKWVENVFLYSTVFCTSEALKRHATSLMLHTVRKAASQCAGVEQVYVGPYKYDGGKGVDGFYLARGCKIVRTPAFLHINPVFKWVLASLLPRQYRKMLGELDDPAGLEKRFPGRIVLEGAPMPSSEPEIAARSGAETGRCEA